MITLKALIRNLKQQYPLADLSEIIKFLKQECVETSGPAQVDLKHMMELAAQCMKSNKVLVHLEAPGRFRVAPPNISESVVLTAIQASADPMHNSPVTQLLALDTTHSTQHSMHFGALRHILKIMALHKDRASGKHTCRSCCEGILLATAKTDTLLATVMKEDFPSFADRAKVILRSKLTPVYGSTRIAAIYLELISQHFGEPSNNAEAAERLTIAEHVALGTMFSTEELIKLRAEEDEHEEECRPQTTLLVKIAKPEGPKSKIPETAPTKKEYLN